MFKGQPKGLYALALANTGERFGYYTMLAIFTLFLQAKFGFSAAATSNIFAGFLALVYFLPLLGGILADKFGYGKMVVTGIIVMFAGYVALAIPASNGMDGKIAMFGALFLIALGTGLFKGNLQVMVGNLYDAPEYQSKRDAAFSLFYMAINIGSMFAPTAATKITEYFMGKAGLTYDGAIPELCHQYLAGDTAVAERLTELATQQAAFTGDLAAFANTYITELYGAYHWGFAVACVSLVLSMGIYLGFRSWFKHADVNAKQAAASGNQAAVQELTPEQTKSRITALMLVFAVVIFFWMAFHQNGLTLTYFANEFVQPLCTGVQTMWFDIINLVMIVAIVYAGFSLVQSKETKSKVISGVVIAAALGVLAYKYLNISAEGITLSAPIFQQFNPFYVVALTPFSMALFGALAKKGKEPSAPRKIALGMVVATVAYIVMAVACIGLLTPNAQELARVAGEGATFVNANVLIYTYLILTFAELLLSPMGISFVSKVAPPKYKGMMMGGWFVATAIGNYLVSIGGNLWGDMPLWGVWSVFVGVCAVAAIFMYSMMNKLEDATK